ncbi:related to nop15-protein involved in 60s ribosomal subunit biogenesis [Ceraceosorus bombacis]|uniref:Related to nop15-protein involved in 60s ribosomal subunit biogenesis n=1 Tax=Ceraceosorus bombacis TaxID=401625 RepID=A0A0P1BGB6_9BASI|nr:related to nop15-protein involved in 60s ribosomal subunit biogenesis [Ceraceosorus bombacis]
MPSAARPTRKGAKVTTAEPTSSTLKGKSKGKGKTSSTDASSSSSSPATIQRKAATAKKDKNLDAEAKPKARLAKPSEAARKAKEVSKDVGTDGLSEIQSGKMIKGTIEKSGGKKRTRSHGQEASTRPKKQSQSLKSSKSKSPLVASELVISDEEDAEDSEVDAGGDETILRGLSVSASESGLESDSDDSEEEVLDTSLAVGELVRLPSSKQDADVKARLDAVARKKNLKGSSIASIPSVLYFGRLPKHFIEPALKSYLEQFGKVNRLRLSRNKRTGASKHYAFVEFEDGEVAKIVQETMDNYLIEGRLLQVRQVPAARVHPSMWIGANRTFRKIPRDRLARVQHDKPRNAEQRAEVERKLLDRQEKKKAALKAKGIDYDFVGYA